MIFTQHTEQHADRQALASHLETILRDAGVLACEDDPILLDIIHAVACYCIDHPTKSVFSSDYLGMLIGQALHRMNYHGTGDRVLDCLTDPTTAALCGTSDHGPISQWRFRASASGILQLSKEWVFSQTPHLWIIDLDDVKLDGRAITELEIFRQIRILLETLDGTREDFASNGVVAIKGLGRQIQYLLGPGASVRQRAAVRGELLLFCRDTMRKLCLGTNPESTPLIIDLDMRRDSCEHR